MCPEFIPTVQIIRALVTVNVIFFWTTKSYPIWSHFSFQIFPCKVPIEMISPSPQECGKEKSRWKRKKSQLWSFSFFNLLWSSSFSLFVYVFPLLPTLCSQTFTKLTIVHANAIKGVCSQDIQIPRFGSPAVAIFPSISACPMAHVTLSTASFPHLRIHTIISRN